MVDRRISSETVEKVARHGQLTGDQAVCQPLYCVALQIQTFHNLVRVAEYHVNC